MPNGDGTRKGKKWIGLISKTQLCTCIALFYKFLFVVVFHDCKLPSYMFYGWNVVCAHKRFCCQFVFLFALICSSLPLIFTLLVASISQFLTAVTKISCCSRNEIRLLLFISRFSSFSVIHVSKDTMKIKSNKDSAYLSFCLYVRQNVLVVEREIS